MITYKFPVREFSASEGYARFRVVNGELKLSKKPGVALLNLIKKHGGEEKIARKRKEVK